MRKSLSLLPVVTLGLTLEAGSGCVPPEVEEVRGAVEEYCGVETTGNVFDPMGFKLTAETPRA